MTKVEELRDKIYNNAVCNILKIADEFNYSDDMDKRSEEAKSEVETDLDSLIAAAREEGAELERARIRDSNPFVFTGEYYVLPASVLAPKEESK
jgi:hypothetical protein